MNHPEIIANNSKQINDDTHCSSKAPSFPSEKTSCKSTDVCETLTYFPIGPNSCIRNIYKWKPSDSHTTTPEVRDIKTYKRDDKDVKCAQSNILPHPHKLWEEMRHLFPE